MCTVTFIPNARGWHLTSNRDERISRPTLPPAKRSFHGVEMMYPLDVEKGGTWIAFSFSGKACCLLNGAFESHQSTGSYRHSRGIIPLSEAASPFDEPLHGHVLEGVEPFTLVTIDFSKTGRLRLSEFRWDGSKKHQLALDPGLPYLWASPTLYDSHERIRRQDSCKNWIRSQPECTAEGIFEFHQGLHYQGNDLAQDGIKTVSISQIRNADAKTTMTYLDIMTNNHWGMNTAKR